MQQEFPLRCRKYTEAARASQEKTDRRQPNRNMSQIVISSDNTFRRGNSPLTPRDVMHILHSKWVAARLVAAITGKRTDCGADETAPQRRSWQGRKAAVRAGFAPARAGRSAGGGSFFGDHDHGGAIFCFRRECGRVRRKRIPETGVNHGLHQDQIRGQSGGR